MKIIAKGNRFASLNGITDAGNGHFKFLRKIGQRYFQFARCPVAKQYLCTHARFLTILEKHISRINAIQAKVDIIQRKNYSDRSFIFKYLFAYSRLRPDDDVMQHSQERLYELI